MSNGYSYSSFFFSYKQTENQSKLGFHLLLLLANRVNLPDSLFDVLHLQAGVDLLCSNEFVESVCVTVCPLRVLFVFLIQCRVPFTWRQQERQQQVLFVLVVQYEPFKEGQTLVQTDETTLLPQRAVTNHLQTLSF